MNSEGRNNLHWNEYVCHVSFYSRFTHPADKSTQITALVRTTNEEASAWAENSTFYKDILSKPWVVSERRQQQARIEAEGVKREREARKERKRKKKAPEEKQERNGREKKSRGGERKREEHRAKDASQTQGFVKTARLNGATGLKQIFRRAATGNFDALGL